jgi:hypothetical protein
MIGTRWRVGGAIATLALAVAVPAGPASADNADGAVAACTEQTATVAARTVVFVPPHVNGDTDFAGHGPRVTVRTHVRDDVWDRSATTFSGTVHIEIFMQAVETTSDFTSATGSRTELSYIAPLGFYVVITDTFRRTDEVSYTDTDTSNDVFGPGFNSFVSQYTIVGDTGGGDAGTDTMVTIHTKPIHLKLSTCPV